ncbi:MAG: peptidoglycan -binding protein [Pseudomonadota bacterium]
MALTRTRAQQRMSGSIWPGFVDAMTALLLVLMFVLTIFMILQYVLQETISGQESELDELAGEVVNLAQALGLEQRRVADLEDAAAQLSSDLSDAENEVSTQAALIATLTGQVATQEAQLAENQERITAFEAQVAGLLSQRDEALGTVAALEETQERLISEQEALQLALAQARTEIDVQAEEARLAAARREALEALTADLQAEAEAAAAELDETEAARLAEAAAAEALRERLENADAELTAMTLALEEQRRDAENTLTLLAAAQAARDEAEASADAQISEAERQAALLAVANAALEEEEAKSADSLRRVTLLNEQIAALRTQLGSLQSLLDDAREQDELSQVQIEALGSQLNTALARAVAEERRRAELEERERLRLEAEAQDLERYRSEFFGELRGVLGDVDGVEIVGDRFVFSSEVLFESASADLAQAGQGQIVAVSQIMLDVADRIPEGLDWILRVDGHTDNIPLQPGAEFADNWELSQARALSVVRFMIDDLGFPPDRLAAAGFGEFRPVNAADTAQARAQNRRIELKLTER